MRLIGNWINQAIENHGNDEKLALIYNDVKTLCASFPVPGISSTEASIVQELRTG